MKPSAAAEPKRLTVLGATGSIGRSTFEVVEAAGGAYAIEAVTARGNAEELARLSRRHGAKLAVVAEAEAYAALKAALSGSGIEAAAGPRALEEAAARPADLVVAAMVGAAGLRPTLAAVHAGRAVALANKECLVSAGGVFMAAVRQRGVPLLPVDSEHNAIFQALDGSNRDAVERIAITASGGPFREWPVERIASATAADALKHPNWSMGAKVTIDSATMMNKGLEVIEAHHLFGFPAAAIEVLVHPQSVVHGIVHYADGSMIAQMAAPDMRTPIAYCLAWPRRGPSPSRRVDLARLGALTFAAPDLERFPALTIARQALAEGDRATNMMNAANEVAVAAFLDGKIGFGDIARIAGAAVEAAIRAPGGGTIAGVDEAEMLDRQGRRVASEFIAGQSAATHGRQEKVSP
ncbi:MAG: 1-deoxy-D-xylulose-5-phosphate reductoisomerase [Bauldia sp.]